MVFGDRKDALGLKMLTFAKKWMKFVMTKCERGRGTRPRYGISLSSVPYAFLLSWLQKLMR